MLVFAHSLLAAAETMRSKDMKIGKLADAPLVKVTPEQLQAAGEILRDGPQPIANGIKADMPGFIEPEDQDGDVFVFTVGILPSRTYRIARDGTAAGEA